MHIGNFSKEQRDIADRVIGSIINVNQYFDPRTLVIGGYLSAQPIINGDHELTDEMVDAMVEHLAECRKMLEISGVVELGERLRIVPLDADYWTPPDAS